MKRKHLGWILFLVALWVCSIAATAALAAEQKPTGKTVNINTTTADELVKSIPGMTPDIAKNIVKYRKDNGDFMQIEELLQVKGMNRTLLNKWKGFFLLEGIGGSECTC